MIEYQPRNRSFVPNPSSQQLAMEMPPINYEPQRQKTNLMQKHRNGLQPQPFMRPRVPNNAQQQERPLSMISSKRVHYSSNDPFKSTKTKHMNNTYEKINILKILLVMTLVILTLGAVGITIYGLIYAKMITTPTTVTISTSTTSTTTTSTTTTTTTTTAASLPSQCQAYSSINDVTRLYTVGGGTISDVYMFTGTYAWYRFIGSGGTQIVTSAPNYYACGTYYSGWYTGSMPTYGNTYAGTVCYVYTSICTYSNTILVTNCGSYYVYGLIDTPVASYSRYCTM